MKWLIAPEKDFEEKILKRYGWPSLLARNELFLHYLGKFQGNLRIRYRWVRRNPRLDLDDLVGDAVVKAFANANRWEPQKGPFAIVLGLYGTIGARSYIARFSSTISRSKTSMEVGVPAPIMCDLSEWNVPTVDPIEPDPFLRERVTLLRRQVNGSDKITPKQKKLFKAYWEGEDHGMSRALAHHHRKGLREGILRLYPNLRKEVFGDDEQEWGKEEGLDRVCL